MCMSNFQSRAVLGLLGSLCSGRASSLMTAALASWYTLRSGRGICIHVVLGSSNRSSCVMVSNHCKFFKVRVKLRLLVVDAALGWRGCWCCGAAASVLSCAHMHEWW